VSVPRSFDSRQQHREAHVASSESFAALSCYANPLFTGASDGGHSLERSSQAIKTLSRAFPIVPSVSSSLRLQSEGLSLCSELLSSVRPRCCASSMCTASLSRVQAPLPAFRKKHKYFQVVYVPQKLGSLHSNQ